jgi:hypothetical protein
MYSLVGEQHCLQPLDALVTNKNEDTPPTRNLTQTP